MTTKITKFDVFYFANQLAGTRRLELEAACADNLQVRQWFQELSPTEKELGKSPVREIATDTAEYRRIAALAYRSVEEEEALTTVARLFGGAADLPEPLDAIPARALFCGGGRLAYRDEVPLTIAGDHRSPSMTPIAIPCIAPDFANNRLTICQWATAELGDGSISVTAVKWSGPGKVERFAPVRVEMDKVERLDGTPYWHKEIPLRSLVPNLEASDEVVFYVEPANGTI